MNKLVIPKRIINILILTIIFVLFFLIMIQEISFKCIFLKYLHVPCVSCGMTRAFKYIFNFDFINAFKANIISIPLAIYLVFLVVFLIYDILFDKYTAITVTSKIFSKYYIIIILLLIISFIYNIVTKC